MMLKAHISSCNLRLQSQQSQEICNPENYWSISNLFSFSCCGTSQTKNIESNIKVNEIVTFMNKNENDAT